MTVKKQHAPDLMSGGAIRDGKGRIIHLTYALKSEVLAGSTNVTEGTFDELPNNPNEGDVHILTAPLIDEDYTAGLINPKLERVKYHTGTVFIKGKNAWNRVSNTGNKVNEYDYKVYTHFIPSTGVVKIARIASYSNITFRAIYNVPAPAKETASCTITFTGGSAIGRADNKSAVVNLCFYKQGMNNYLCIKPNGLASITIDLYDVKFYRGSLTPIEPEALTPEQVEDVTYFTELGESKEIVIDPTDTDNVLTLGLRKTSQDDEVAYLDFNANSGIQSIDTEKGLYHIVNTTIFEQNVFYWNGKTCYRSGSSYTTPVEVSDVNAVSLNLDYINPGTYYFVNTKPINNGLTVTSYRDISKQLTNTLDELIPANITIGFTITEDNISFFKKNQGSYITNINGHYPDEEGMVDLDDAFVTISTPQRITGEKKFTGQTYVEHVYFGTGVITNNTPLLESEDGENLRLVNSKLRLERPGSIQSGDNYAVTGDTVYNYINSNVVTLDGNQTIVGTKNFEDLEVNDSIKFNSGLGATPVGTIEVNNNQLKVTDAKLELEQSGNIASGDDYAVNANAVKTFVEGEVNLITLTHDDDYFNINNPANYPGRNKTKTYILKDLITVVNAPDAVPLLAGTIIKYYRSEEYLDEEVINVLIINPMSDKAIYGRRIIKEYGSWHASDWRLFINNIHLENRLRYSIIQTHADNTYNEGSSNAGNVLLGYTNTLSAGSHNFVAGDHNSVSSTGAIVAGSHNTASYLFNTVFGGHNTATNSGASIFGMFSDTDANSYFTIGNGDSELNRSNLLDIKTNGNIIIKYNGSNVILQDLLDGIDDSNSVHKTDDETIGGNKQFSSLVGLSVSGEVVDNDHNAVDGDAVYDAIQDAVAVEQARAESVEQPLTESVFTEGYIIQDLSNLEEHLGYINASNKWTESTTNHYKILPIEGQTRIRVSPYNTNTPIIGFLQSDTFVANQSPVYSTVTGFTKRIALDGASRRRMEYYDVPADAKYLYFRTYNTEDTSPDQSPVIEFWGTRNKITDIETRLEHDEDLSENLLNNARIVNTGTPFTIFQCSDVHGSEETVEEFDRLLVKYKGKYDIAVNTGDLVESTYSQGISFWEGSEINNVWNLIGNHDSSTGSGSTQWNAVPIADVYNRFIAPNINLWDVVSPGTNLNYYYKDFVEQGLRIIALDVMYIDATELSWFETTLTNANNNDLAVIVLAHYPCGTVNSITSTSFASIDGANVEQTAPLALNTDCADKIQTFINNGGEFIAWLCGHRHRDDFGYVVDYPDILNITLEKSSGAYRNTYSSEYRTHDAARTYNDKSSCSFRFITVNRANKTISLVSVGNMRDNYLREKKAICYNYQTHKFISNLGLIDDTVVHKEGTETINGVKTFTNGLNIGNAELSYNNSSGKTMLKASQLQVRRDYTGFARTLAVQIYGTLDAYPRLVAQTLDTTGDTTVATETTSIYLRDDKIGFALDRNTVWGLVNANSNVDTDWTTKQLPTKNAVAAKISAEISNATDVYIQTHTISGMGSATVDITLSEHHRTTYVRVISQNDVPAIQIIAPDAQKGDVIVVDAGGIKGGADGCFTPVKSTNDGKYHYWPSSVAYQFSFTNMAQSVTVNLNASLKWWYDGSDWVILEKMPSIGV